MPSIDQSEVVDASITQVWAMFSDFHDLSWAPNVITTVEKVGEYSWWGSGRRKDS